jgi:hypothetical protein
MKHLVLCSVDVPEALSSGRVINAIGVGSFPPFEKLEIGTYPDDAGVYLMRLCSDGQVADTWHQSFDDAFHQAEFEFGIPKTQWAVAPGLSIASEASETAADFFKRRASVIEGEGLINYLKNAPDVEPDQNDRL